MGILFQIWLILIELPTHRLISNCTVYCTPQIIHRCKTFKQLPVKVASQQTT